MNNCCNTIYPDEDLRRWENCNSTALANPDNYYTKDEVDELLEDIEISGGSVQSDWAEEDDEKLDFIKNKPTKLSDFDNDEGFVGSSELSGYAQSSAVTEEISAAVSGLAQSSAVTALESILTAHTADTGVHTSQAEKDGWNAKLDASAYTPCDLSEYWTSAQTQSAINGATSGLQQTLSAGTGIDITSGNVISVTGGTGGGGISSAECQTMIDASTSGLSDTLSSHTSNTTVHVTQSDKNNWNGKLDASVIFCGSETDYNTVTESGTTIDPDVIYFIYEDPQL